MSKDGGPAFPMIEREYNPHHEEWEYASYGGITVRDYFAAKAMQGILATKVDATDADMSKWSYEMADAMLKAREG